MFNHIMVGSNDLDRSEAFYNAVLGVLGAGPPLRNQSPSGHMRLFYRHDGSTFCVAEPIDGEPATCANGVVGGGFNIATGAWDAEICALLDIPMAILPEVLIGHCRSIWAPSRLAEIAALPVTLPATTLTP